MSEEKKPTIPVTTPPVAKKVLGPSTPKVLQMNNAKNASFKAMGRSIPMKRSNRGSNKGR